MNIDKRLVRKDSLEKLFDILKRNSKTIYAPFTKNGKTTFRETESFSGIATGYIQTTESSKDIAFPRAEKLLEYSKNKEGMTVKGIDINDIPEVILWGVRPCDAAGIGELSSIFNWDYKDEIFNNRLSRVTVFGFSCNKSDEYCFCTSVGGNPGNTAGSDILFTRMGDDGDYLAEVLTEKGLSVVSMATDLFEKSETSGKEKFLAEVQVRFNHEEIKERLSKYFESKEWVEQSMRCLGCGACAYVCPTCACFDIQDEAHGRKGSRVRCWDSCGFSHFTLHTSGHNPRDVQSARWRQRIMHKFSYMPYLMRIERITYEAPGVKTFMLKFVNEADQDKFSYKAGQFGEYSVYGVGESTFCIASSPTRKGYIECTFRQTGKVTNALSDCEEGSIIGFRGPYGNVFPIDEWKGKNLLFIAGGIALPPMRCVIWNALDMRENFKDVTIIYGARTVKDLVYKDELKDWELRKDVKLVTTVDPGGESPDWRGEIGFVPTIVEKIAPSSKDTIAIVCGPPVMIKYTFPVLAKLGFSDNSIYTTLENRMKCGFGKCGRCNVGKVYVCKDGPVFTLAQLKELPDEY